jgi:DNA-binding transcriptional MocR family regulator
VIEEIRAHLRAPTPQGLARAVALAAESGQLGPGNRLPTVRELARALALSPSTVGAAWRILAAHGMIETRGRRGSFLREPAGLEPVRHFRRVTGANVDVDVSTGYPDPALLPDPREFLRLVADGPAFAGYPESTLDPALRTELEALLPFSPGALTLATDSLTALAELLPVVTRFGDTVVVGEAEFAPYLDLFERFGLTCASVPHDAEGPDAEAVAAQLRAGARLVVLQPRVHNPTGIVTSAKRLRQIGALCRDSDCQVLEVDHYGWLASSPARSAASVAPAQTIHLRPFSKDLHPDLRVCVIAGPADVVERLHQRRVGGGWVSRVNQDLLRHMLVSTQVREVVSRAKEAYDDRRSRLLAVLRREGITTLSRDGLNVWVPVHSEQAALIYLASRGISAAPGSPFQSAPAAPPHIRVSIAQLGTGLEEVAAHVAAAAVTRRLSAMKPNP